ncbi:MAG: His-Xaa-Ser system radical SAM maturase HxsB [Elusimicrobia bacterium RBG_16_66_12]|nr:MAG: His-Xaa-Ser system radical SAM maturase HxsB [Elusimicrobia bacterium RBG_16_66_12]
MSVAVKTAEFPVLNPQKAGFFRFRRIKDDYLITNDFGRHRVLTASEFKSFVEGSLDEASPLCGQLARDGFIRDRMDFDALTAVWRTRNRFLWQGPSLHIVVVTLRCNHRCLYCQANSVPMKDKSSDMSLETARKVVDRIFQSPNPAITIEFQGGEPLANWPAVEFIVDYAREKNQKAGKSLWINLVTNLSLLDDAKLKFLLKHQVNFCTSIDGPGELHNKNRLFVGGDSHADASRWFKKIHKKTAGKPYRIDALLTVTRFSLPRYKEIVDEYAGLGMRGIFLRSLSQLGLARETWAQIGYEPDEFLEFYRKALDYIIALNKRKNFFEQTARLFLTKILGDVDPNFLDLRSPCGAGVGQIAYNFDGGIYTCDEGRMFSRMGDESFRIGSVDGGSYGECVGHPVVRAISVASTLDNQVQCSKCAYKPYCGVCPVKCYGEQGDIVGRMPSNSNCRIQMGIQDMLFERLQDPKIEKIFRKWIRERVEPVLYQR